MIPDPMSNFYDALCVGIDWFENLNTDGFFQLSPDNSGRLIPSCFQFLIPNNWILKNNYQLLVPTITTFSVTST